MLTDSEDIAKAWVPNLPVILAGTAMLDPQQKTILQLPPRDAGDYLIVLTFPGQRAILRGELKVGRK